MATSDLNDKLNSALKLLDSNSTTVDKFKSVHNLLKGVDPRIDTHLEKVSKALSAYEKVAEGDLIELTTENLPEKTEKDKKRKKALLFLIRSWNDLKSEVNRVQKEFKNNQSQTVKTGKIIKFAKGPFGIITLIAVVIVGFSLFKTTSAPKKAESTSKSTLSPTVDPNTPKIKVIIVDGKQIPLEQLHTGQGPECLDSGTPAQHYHANTGVATALDGTQMTDPGGCGFGKMKDVKILEVEPSRN